MQNTIGKVITLNGNTLYSNKLRSIKFYPSNAYTGIYINNIYIHISNLKSSLNSKLYLTEINNIKLIEHLLSALYYLNLTNLYIELEGDEIPIFDGASKYFIDNLKPYLKSLNYPLEYYHINNNIEVIIEEPTNKILNHISHKRYIKIKKGDYNIKCQVEFPYANKQEFILNNIENYEFEISNHKTFMNIEYYKYTVENLQLKGANNSNMIIFDNNYKFEGTELVRHKILDIIGDLALLNIKIIGNIDALCSGHKLHQKLASKIYNEYTIQKYKDTNIKEISYNDAKNYIKTYKLKPYYDLNHFSFDLKLYNKLFLIFENDFYYIFPNKPLDHWSPLCVYTNYHKENSNYFPFYIKLIKNCILYKIDDNIRQINPNIRYYWKTKCDLNYYLKFRNNISKNLSNFPNINTYNKYNNYINKYDLEIKCFNYTEFEIYYNKLKKLEHKSAKEIPIPNIDNKYIKLVFLKYNNEIIFVAPIIDKNKTVTILNMATNTNKQLLKDAPRTIRNFGVGNIACFKLFEYYCNQNYVNFDVGISRVYGTYKNKLFIERYQFNEILDY